MEPTIKKTNKPLWLSVLIILILILGFFVYSYRLPIKKFLGMATVADFYLQRAMTNEWTTSGHAWGENVGWISFQETNGDIYVGDYALTGYAWGENIGWISLNCEQQATTTCSTVQYAVENDGEGHLSGYAWGENVGWIDFHPTNGGVVIDRDGLFAGYAWGENIGWINFEATGSVSTTWRHQSDRPECNNGLDDDEDGLIDFGLDINCSSNSDIKESSNGSSAGGNVGQDPENYGGDSTDTTDATSTSSTTVPVSTSTPTTGPSGEQPTTGPSTNQPSISIDKFTRDLTIGDVGDDVNALQRYLNSNGFVLAQEGVGSIDNETTYFGNRTRDALKKYQEAFASEILEPLGLTSGTGYFGGATRSHINARIGE